MRKLSPADVADAGLVRLGAGIRAPRALPLRPTGRPLRRPIGGQAGNPAAPILSPAPLLPADVADAGLLRLGAGIRRG